MTRTSTIRVFDTLGGASRELARALVEAAGGPGDAAETGFGLALSGGSTPRPLFELLATELRDDIDWSRVHVFWADERFVPRSSPESNVGLVAEALLDPVGLPERNRHAPPPPEESASLDEAARAYEERLSAYLRDGGTMDCVVLGLGEDGHIASLFPGSPVDPEPLVVAVPDAPNAPPQRISMSSRLLTRFRQTHVLVAGESKAAAVRNATRGPDDPDRFPSHRLRGSATRLVWWLDREAAGRI